MVTGMAIGVSVLAGVGGLLFILHVVFSRIRHRMEQRVQERFNRSEILAASVRANFFGEGAKGGAQVRGTGALVLTRDVLWFLRAVPEKEYILPLERVTGVSLPTSFNRKSIFRRLLCVHYRTDDGEDAMAWAVKDPEKWKAAIETQIDS